MATTKDRLEQLTDVERDLHNRDVVTLEDIWEADEERPPPGCRRRTGGYHPPLVAAIAPARADQRALGGNRRHCLGAARGDRDRGRTAAHQPERCRPLVPRRPRHHLVGRGRGGVRRLLAAAALEPGGLADGIRPAGGLHPCVPGIRPPLPGWRLVGRPAGLWAGAGGDQHPWPAAGLNRGRHRGRLGEGDGTSGSCRHARLRGPLCVHPESFQDSDALPHRRASPSQPRSAWSSSSRTVGRPGQLGVHGAAPPVACSLSWPRRRLRRRPQCLEVFEELADAERFDEGVVGAGVQCGLPVGLGGPGQQQDGRGGGLA